MLLPALMQAENASAASFKLLDDGKVQIDAFGETLLFRKEDAFSFGPLRKPCYAPEYGSEYRSVASVSEILSNKQLRDCIEKTTPDEPDNVGGQLSVGPIRHGDDVYPGPVRANVFPKLDSRIGIVLPNRGGTWNCNGLFANGPQDELGFTNQPIGYPSEKARAYQLKASLRTGAASRALCVICKPILGDTNDQRCIIHLETPDGQTSMSLVWDVLGFHGPDASWLTYDATARTIADSIFVKRPKGDLQ